MKDTTITFTTIAEYPDSPKIGTEWKWKYNGDKESWFQAQLTSSVFVLLPISQLLKYKHLFKQNG